MGFFLSFPAGLPLERKMNTGTVRRALIPARMKGCIRAHWQDIPQLWLNSDLFRRPAGWKCPMEQDERRSIRMSFYPCL
jgi:hypothetical protein